MPLDPIAFFQKLLPSAQEVRSATGIPVSVTLAQYADESGFEGGSWIGGNNYSGITNGGPPNFLKFTSIEDFTKSQIHTLGLSYYTNVRAVANLGGDPFAVAEALGRSPWDAGHYADADLGTPGSALARIMKQYNLTQYDAPANTTSTPSAPAETAPYTPRNWVERGIYSTDLNLLGEDPATAAQDAAQAGSGNVVSQVNQALGTLNATVLKGSWWSSMGSRILMVVLGLVVVGVAVLGIVKAPAGGGSE